MKSRRPPDMRVWGPCISSEPLIPEEHSRRVTSGLVVKTHRKQNSAPIQYLGSWCRPCCTTGRTLGRWRPRDPWPPSGLWPESLQVTPEQLQEKNNTWRWVLRVLSQTHYTCVCACMCYWLDFAETVLSSVFGRTSFSGDGTPPPDDNAVDRKLMADSRASVWSMTSSEVKVTYDPRGKLMHFSGSQKCATPGCDRS